MPAEGGRSFTHRKLCCCGCQNWCEVAIPDPGRKKFRYLIRCPTCGHLNDLKKLGNSVDKSGSQPSSSADMLPASGGKAKNQEKGPAMPLAPPSKKQRTERADKKLTKDKIMREDYERQAYSDRLRNSIRSRGPPTWQARHLSGPQHRNAEKEGLRQRGSLEDHSKEVETGPRMRSAEKDPSGTASTVWAPLATERQRDSGKQQSRKHDELPDSSKQTHMVVEKMQLRHTQVSSQRAEQRRATELEHVRGPQRRSTDLEEPRQRGSWEDHSKASETGARMRSAEKDPSGTASTVWALLAMERQRDSGKQQSRKHDELPDSSKLTHMVVEKMQLRHTQVSSQRAEQRRATELEHVSGPQRRSAEKEGLRQRGSFEDHSKASETGARIRSAEEDPSALEPTAWPPLAMERQKDSEKQQSRKRDELQDSSKQAHEKMQLRHSQVSSQRAEQRRATQLEHVSGLQHRNVERERSRPRGSSEDHSKASETGPRMGTASTLLAPLAMERQRDSGKQQSRKHDEPQDSSKQAHMVAEKMQLRHSQVSSQRAEQRRAPELEHVSGPQYRKAEKEGLRQRGSSEDHSKALETGTRMRSAEEDPSGTASTVWAPLAMERQGDSGKQQRRKHDELADSSKQAHMVVAEKMQLRHSQVSSQRAEQRRATELEHVSGPQSRNAEKAELRQRGSWEDHSKASETGPRMRSAEEDPSGTASTVWASLAMERQRDSGKQQSRKHDELPDSSKQAHMVVQKMQLRHAQVSSQRAEQRRATELEHVRRPQNRNAEQEGLRQRGSSEDHSKASETGARMRSAEKDPSGTASTLLAPSAKERQNDAGKQQSRKHDELPDSSKQAHMVAEKMQLRHSQVSSQRAEQRRATQLEHVRGPQRRSAEKEARQRGCSSEDQSKATETGARMRSAEEDPSGTASTLLAPLAMERHRDSGKQQSRKHDELPDSSKQAHMVAEKMQLRHAQVSPRRAEQPRRFTKRKRQRDALNTTQEAEILMTRSRSKSVLCTEGRKRKSVLKRRSKTAETEYSIQRGSACAVSMSLSTASKCNLNGNMIQSCDARKRKLSESDPPQTRLKGASGKFVSDSEASEEKVAIDCHLPIQTPPGEERSLVSTRGMRMPGGKKKTNKGMGHRQANKLCASASGGDCSHPAKSRSNSSHGKPVSTDSSGCLDDDLDGFLVEESTDRISVRSREKVSLKEKNKVELIPRLGGVPPPQKTVERVALSALPTCEQAFQAASKKPRWQLGDNVEVAFEGKGFEGAWAAAYVVMPDGKRNVLVRFHEFVDNDGTPLVENMGIERLRLPPPPHCDSNWMPRIGEQVEGLWNDAWWEGSVIEHHFLKGVLFQYDRYANWLWLPLRCIRPRPSHESYYPIRARTDEADEDGSDLEQEREGACGWQGCKLPNNHLGLCQVHIEGNRRAKVKATTEIQEQAQLWNEIKTDRRISHQVAVARAESLKKTEEAGVSIRASKGNIAQAWHANFKLDEFVQPFYFTRDMCVLQEYKYRCSGSDQTTRLVDAYQMLMTEHQLCPEGHWHLICVDSEGNSLVDLGGCDPQSDMIQLLPDSQCDILVKNCPAPPGVLSGVIKSRVCPYGHKY